MTPKHTTIANHLNATSFTDADKRLLRQCFLAAVGPEGADTPIGPQSLVVEPAGWVVRGTHADGKQAHTISADGAFETHGKPYVFRLKDLADSDARVWVKSCPKWTAAARWRGANGWGATPAEVTPLASQPFCGLGSRFVALPYAKALRLDAAERAPTPTVEPLIAMHGDDQCIATRGWRCSLRAGHDGPHKHCRSDGTAHAIWAADSEPPPAPSGPWVVAVTMRGERRYETEAGGPSPALAQARRWDVQGGADWAAQQWGTDCAATVLPLAEAERLAGAAPTAAERRQAAVEWAHSIGAPPTSILATTVSPAPPPREVVGYRVRQVRDPEWCVVASGPTHPLGFWRTPRTPPPVERREAKRLLKLAREWDGTATERYGFRLVPVTRPARQRPDVSAAIAACEEALALCSLRGKDDALRTALAALRGQR